MPNKFYNLRSLSDNFLSRVSSRYFWFDLSLTSEFLKKSSEYVALFIFLEKIASCACLIRSGLNYIFHWYAQSHIFNISLLSVEIEILTQFTIPSKEL